MYTTDGQGSPPFSNVDIERSHLSFEEMLLVGPLSQNKASYAGLRPWCVQYIFSL